MKEGWKIYTLGELCEMRRGLTYSKNDEADFSSNVVLRSNNVDLEYKKLDFTELKYLKEDFVIPEDRKVQEGSFLICMSNGSKKHLGKVALIDKNYGYAFGGFMGLLVPDNTIVRSKYLWTVLSSQRYADYIKSLSDGAGINNLKYKDIAAFEVPVPPLSEQEKIVSYLDAQFAKIDALKTNTASRLQAAKDLFQSALKEMLTPKEGWEDLYLVKEFDLRSGEYLPNKDQIGGKFPVYGGNGITGYHNEFNAYGEHILFDRVSALCGNIHYTNEKIWVTDNAFVVKGINNKWHIRFLTYELQFMNLNKYASQTAQPVISNKSMREVLIYRPSLPEQERIAARLDSLSEKVKALQENYNKTLVLCNDLKQSLLKSIFE